jgi:hypothetical protein
VPHERKLEGSLLNKACTFIKNKLVRVFWSFMDRKGYLIPYYENECFLIYSYNEERNVIRLIQQQCVELKRRYEKLEDYCIVVGGRTCATEVSADYDPGYSMLELPVELTTNSASRTTLYGLTVHVVPWLEGVAVLPRKIFLEESNEIIRSSPRVGE